LLSYRSGSFGMGFPLLSGLFLLLLASSCGRGGLDPFSDEEEGEIHLVRIEPRSDQVFLNQKILLVFDKPLDPQFVTEGTLKILSSDGTPVPGERIVRGNTVEFVPVPPLAPDLQDGSFRPGEHYRLYLSHFPLPIAIRGSQGELLFKVPSKSWTAVDPKNLPEGYPSPLLPSAPSGPFVLIPPPKFVLHHGEPVLRVRFNHSLFPPTVRPEAFRILSTSGFSQTIPIARTRILPREGPGGVGSMVEISPAWDLAPGLYRLFFQPGIRGVQDDRLQPLKIWEIQPGTGLPKLRDLSQKGAWVEFLVDKRIPPKVFHDFEPPRLGLVSLSQIKGTGWNPEGPLQWGPKGLYAPNLDFQGFRSMGELRVEKELILKAGKRLPGTDWILPEDGRPWDFDRLILAPGARLVLFLNPKRPTTIRVAGRVDLGGILQFHCPEDISFHEESSTSVLLGDPRPSWPQKRGQLRLFVGGWVRTADSLVVETLGSKQKGLLGFLWARGPLSVGASLKSRVQIWEKPPPATPPKKDPSPLQLPGSWMAISPWFPIPQKVDGMYFEGFSQDSTKNLLKGILVGIPKERMDLQFLLQLRRRDGTVLDWEPSSGLKGLGDANFIRLAVLWAGGLVTADPLLRSFGIR